jgi:hypothetical protein
MQMDSSPDISELSKAQFSIQNNLPPVIKDARNSFVGNDYATLNSVMETCRDALYSHGIWLVQLPCPAPVELGTGHIGLETRLTHIESGQWLSSVTVIPLPKSDPQGLGSALTYARRYSLCTILGIITEDDDGNAASVHPQRQHRPQSQPKTRAQDKTRSPNSSTQCQSNTSLPRLDGVAYKNVQTDDGRMCVVATGSTLEKKELLRAAGFKWNPQQKIWWKYADVA